MEKDEFNLAITDFDIAIQNDENNTLAYYNRGISYALKRDYERALSDFNRIIKIDPNHALAYYARGGIYLYELKDKIKARQSFQKALELGFSNAQEMLDELK